MALVPRVRQTITDWVNAGTMSVIGTTANPTKGTVSIDSMRWRRIGDSMHVRIAYRQTAAGTAGTGDYLFLMPLGYQIDLAKVESYTTVEGQGSNYQNGFACGVSQFSNSTNSYDGVVTVYDANSVRAFGFTDGGAQGTIGSTSSFGLAQTNMFYTLDFVVPIVGWTS